MVGAVGGRDGYFQSLIRPTLEESGLDISRVRTVDDDQTGVSVIVVSSCDAGDNRIFFSPGANYSGMQPTPAVIIQALAAPIPDLIVMQGEIPLETTILILRRICRFKQRNREEGQKGIDIGPTEFPEDAFAGVDHLIMNETEADLMAPSAERVQHAEPNADSVGHREQAASYFHGRGVACVVITLGAKGAWYSVNDIRESNGGVVKAFSDEVPAATVGNVLDTTAAGDTFVGGYATYIARWREALRNEGKVDGVTEETESEGTYRAMAEGAIKRGALAAARCVERHGSMRSIPWENEI
ncbi:unnamed protein product [Clonostachys chloroleuca]|uniref:Carbohydrate kinase PfkB domain-containing protein n=1 Tax=Clonostachys chloroleuca TaxID=1926264 RepID=A0AA35LRG9_9HYPO|nr:unnamed protein product [Clonostachys chloroleuca]